MRIQTQQQLRVLSPLDRDDGYTNRQMVDIPTLILFLIYLKSLNYYSPKRVLWEKQLLEEHGYIFRTALETTEPFVRVGQFSQRLPTLIKAKKSTSEFGELTSTEAALGTATAISGRGWIVGEGRFSIAEDNRRAQLWHPQYKSPIDLGTGDVHGISSLALGVNDNGKIVGMADIGASVFHAFLWEVELRSGKPEVKRHDLGTLGGAQSCATAINATDMIVGWAEDSRFLTQACRWKNGFAAALQLPPGCVAARATTVNDRGEAAGNADRSDGTMQPTFWDKIGRATILPATTLPATVRSLNNRSQGVGTMGEGTEKPRAVLWENGQFQDLNDFLPPKTDWILYVATGINDLGQIAGWGRYKGRLSGWRMTKVAG